MFNVPNNICRKYEDKKSLYTYYFLANVKGTLTIVCYPTKKAFTNNYSISIAYSTAFFESKGMEYTDLDTAFFSTMYEKIKKQSSNILKELNKYIPEK